MRPVQSVNRQDQANELARSGDAGVGALCRYAQASGLIRHRIRLTDCMCHHIIQSHLSSHASHPIKGNHPSHKRVYVQSLLFHISQFSRALSAGKAPRPARLRHARRQDGIFSTPPPIPYSSAASVAAPCVGAPGCHGFSPLLATWLTVQFRQLTKPGSPEFRQSHGAD